MLFFRLCWITLLLITTCVFDNMAAAYIIFNLVCDEQAIGLVFLKGALVDLVTTAVKKFTTKICEFYRPTILYKIIQQQ